MTMKLYVGNLAFATSSQDLQELFAAAGTVESASVVEDRDTGRSRGFGFVEMSSKEEGEAAIAQFNGKEVNGRSLNVNEAKPRENRGGGGGGGRGGSAAVAAAAAVTVVIAAAAAATAAAVAVAAIASPAGSRISFNSPGSSVALRRHGGRRTI